MRREWVKLLATVTISCAGGIACAQSAVATAYDGSQAFTPVHLSLQPADPDSVYAPPAPPSEREGVNEGGVHFDLSLGYFTDYIFRGVEIFEPPGAEDRVNLQVLSHISWDLGKLPHPFLGVFVNYADSDPVSSFQEIRPVFGFDWNIRPLLLSAGHNTYIYIDRNDAETSDVWVKATFDDSYLLKTDRPLLSPYIYAAYDYDLYSGWYIEGGVSHDFVIEDTGLTFTAQASAAYIRGFDFFSTQPNQKNVNGFQHYQLGLIANYSLNNLLNITPRYGDWSLVASLFYTDGLDHDLLSTTQLWGGAGIQFKY